MGINGVDAFIQETEPFKLVKTDLDTAKEIIKKSVIYLGLIAQRLKPFMPDTTEVILKAVQENKKPENLFNRILTGQTSEFKINGGDISVTKK